MTISNNRFVNHVRNAIEKLADALDPERKPPFKGDILDLLEWATKDVLEMRQQLAESNRKMEYEQLCASELEQQLDAAEVKAAHVKEIEIPYKVKVVEETWRKKLDAKDVENDSLRQQLAAMTESYAKVTERIHMVGGYLDQLAEREKQVTLLRNVVERLITERRAGLASKEAWETAREALAATVTTDLFGYILCEKEPAARLIPMQVPQGGNGRWWMARTFSEYSQEESLNDPNRRGAEVPLYRAKEQGR